MVSGRKKKIPTPDAPLHERLGTPWYFFVISFISTTVVVCVAASAIFYKIRSDQIDDEKLKFSQLASSTANRVSQGFAEITLLDQGLRGLAVADVLLNRTAAPNCMSSDLADRNQTIASRTFTEYCKVVSRGKGYLERMSLRPCGVEAGTIYPTTELPELHVEFPQGSQYSLGLRLAAMGKAFYSASRSATSGEVLYLVMYAVYNTLTPSLNFSFVPEEPAGAFASLRDLWGYATITFNLDRYLHEHGSVRALEDAQATYMVQMRQNGVLNPRLVYGPGANDSTTMMQRTATVSEDTDIIVFLAPQGGWISVPSSEEHAIIVLVSLVIVAIVHFIWFFISYRLMVRREERYYRSRFAPRNAPVPMMVLELFDPAATWVENPIEMAQVSRRVKEIITTIVSTKRACCTQTRNECSEIVSRSADELLSLVAEASDQIKKETWTQPQLRAFRGSIHVHATLHIAEKVLATYDKSLDVVGYKGRDVSDLYQLHAITNSGRHHDILITSAFEQAVKSPELKQEVMKAPDIYGAVEQHFGHHATRLKMPINTESVFPLFLWGSSVVETAALSPRSSKNSDHDGEHEANAKENMEASTYSVHSTDSQVASVYSSADSDVESDPNSAFGCPTATLERLERLAEENVSSSICGNVIKIASFFFSAYQVAFAPFPAMEFAPIGRAVDDAFSLTKGSRKGQQISRSELFERLAIRCSRISCGVFRHEDQWVDLDELTQQSQQTSLGHLSSQTPPRHIDPNQATPAEAQAVATSPVTSSAGKKQRHSPRDGDDGI